MDEKYIKRFYSEPKWFATNKDGSKAWAIGELVRVYMDNEEEFIGYIEKGDLCPQCSRWLKPKGPGGLCENALECQEHASWLENAVYEK